MAEPWLPDSCLTSLRAARPVTQIVEAWAEHWFAHAPWQVLGGWDDAPVLNAESFALLYRSSGFEIRGKAAVQKTLALAITGSPAATGLTAYDEDLLRQLGARVIEDLEDRLRAMLALEPAQPGERVGGAFPRVFSLLIGPVGQAQIVIECVAAKLVAMARSTYPQTPIDAPVDSPAAALAVTKVTVAARLGAASISLKELASLETGDLILLDSKPGDHAELLVEGHASSLAFSIAEAGNTCTLEFQEKR